jgi:hypothetical protein
LNPAIGCCNFSNRLQIWLSFFVKIGQEFSSRSFYQNCLLNFRFSIIDEPGFEQNNGQGCGSSYL